MRFLSGWRPLRSRIESVHDYAGVQVPLEEAHLHSHSARTGRAEFEEVRQDDDDERAAAAAAPGSSDDDADKDPDHEGTGMLQMSAAEYTIEGLRRAVRHGEKGRTCTEYEGEWHRRRARKASEGGC